MIRHEIHDDPQAQAVRGIDQRAKLLLRAEFLA
jgi:hypothetical protein